MSERNQANEQPSSNEVVAANEILDATLVLTKIAWRILPFMFLLYVISYLDRINISFAGSDMKSALGFNDETFGRGAGIFFIGYFAFGIPSNLFMVRLGARRWIAAMMIVWGIISMNFAIVSSATMFLVMRFLLGVAEAGFFPGMILYLTYWFPRKEHGLAVARFMSAVPAAGVLGGVVSSMLLGLDGIGGMRGYQWLFLVTGVPAVLFGIGSFFYLDDNPQNAKWLTSSEKEILAAKLSEDNKVSAAPPKDVEKASAVTVLTNPEVWLLGALYFCLGAGMYGYQLWLPQIIGSVGIKNPSTAALLSTIPAVFQALGMVLVAAHSDKKRERRWHVACSVLLAAFSLCLVTLGGSVVFAMIALSVAAFGLWGTVGPFWALPPQYLEKKDAPIGIGIINSMGALGGFTGPYILGFFSRPGSGYQFGLQILAAILVVGALLALASGRTGRSSQTNN